MNADYYIFQKEIDWSVLTDGFSIPVDMQEMFYRNIGFNLNIGEKRSINLCFQGQSFSVSLVNLNFSRKKYSNHKEILQVRYSAKSALAVCLQAMFAESYSFLKSERQKFIEAGRTPPQIRTASKEYLVLYSTAVPGELFVDCITSNEFQEETAKIIGCDEVQFENLINGVDDYAQIILGTKFQKIRHLSRAIGENLKQAYHFRCQICGEYIGERYGSTLIHTHHIDYFSKSLNNNADNIMIVCPNHHLIIHDQNPQFDHSRLEYCYPNGYREGLQINLHLLTKQ